MPKRLCNYPDLIVEKSARKLWYEVLLLAMADLQHRRPRYRKRAQKWLQSSDSDYCFLVMGCNPEQARELLSDRIGSTQPDSLTPITSRACSRRKLLYPLVATLHSHPSHPHQGNSDSEIASPMACSG